VDWGDQSLVPNIEEDARAKDDVKEFKYSQLEYMVCIFDNLIEDTINTTCLFGLEGLYFSCNSFKMKLENSRFVFDHVYVIAGCSLLYCHHPSVFCLKWLDFIGKLRGQICDRLAQIGLIVAKFEMVLFTLDKSRDSEVENENHTLQMRNNWKVTLL
jgi:hypothetical protein